MILTTRHLLSHLGGIRHYKERMFSNEENKTKKENMVCGIYTRGTGGKFEDCYIFSPVENN